MYSVSNNYNRQIYSGDAKHRLSLFFNDVEYEDANIKVEYVKVKSNILSNGEERFNLDNFVSKEVEIKIHDLDLQDIVEPIEISIGTLINPNTYEDVPIGIFNLSEAPTKDGNVTTIKLRDNSVKFDIPYNAEDLIKSQYVVTADATYITNKNYYSYSGGTYTLLVAGTDYEVGDEITGTVYEEKGSVTMKKLLEDICDTCGVDLGTTSFINQNTEISVWDNSITARQYVMYIAEKAGSIATINRDGELFLIPINDNLYTFNLDPYLFESYTEGDRFIISRVVYEDGVRKFEYGSIPEEGNTLYPSLELYPSTDLYPVVGSDEIKQYTTLYIGATNPYITDTTEVENIYNSVKGFSVYGMKISKVLGNPALDPYDLIRFTYKNKTYVTFAQNELTYNGVITQTFATDIGTLEKAQENVTVNSEEARFKKVYTQIDQMNGTIELYSGQVEDIRTTANNAYSGVGTLQKGMANYYTIEQTEQFVADATSGITNTFQTSGGANIFRNTGLWFATSDSNNPYEFWSGKVIKTTEYNAVNRSAMLLQDDTLEQQESVPNGKYNVNFRYKKLITLANVSVVINGTSYTLDSETDTEFDLSLDVSSQYINIHFISDENNSCEVYDLMVNYGAKMAYSQNQNETTTDTVNISKGITITSSDRNTRFKADSDGTRIFNTETNEIKSEFTDKGMRTDELESNKATIANLLIQDVDDQTWLTRI